MIATWVTPLTMAAVNQPQIHALWDNSSTRTPRVPLVQRAVMDVMMKALATTVTLLTIQKTRTFVSEPAQLTPSDQAEPIVSPTVRIAV
jgi:hypothetical protein